MGVFLALVVLPLLLSVSSAAPSDHKGHEEHSHERHVDFSRCHIPKSDNVLPIFSLGASTEFPWAAVKDVVLATSKKGEKFQELDVGNGTIFASEDRVAATFDKATGETTVFSRLSDLKPCSRFSYSAAEKYLGQKAIFPPDDTRISLVPGHSVFNAGVDRSGNKTSLIKPQAYLGTAHLQRNITVGQSQYTVCGPGSKGSFSVDASGKVVSVSHRWRSAKHSGSQLKALPESKIQDAIKVQLAQAKITNATVDKVELCYYDSGKSHIQPVYRFTATPNTTIAGIEPQSVVGYVSAVENHPEQLPHLNGTADVSSPQPATPQEKPPSKEKRQARNPVGFVRYIMQHNENEPLWLQDSQEFLNGLNLGFAINNILCTLGVKFCTPLVNEQYYWSENRFYTNENNFFVDSAALAYQENHGSNHFFCTDSNVANCGGVSLTDIKSTNGYGDGTNHLRYWINRACSFIPSVPDMDINTAAAPWWNVFDGLHAALGFRVTSYCRDGTTFGVGFSAALGVGMVSSWMHIVNNAYPSVKNGAPSAVAVCGHSDDTLYDRQDLGVANCLTFWYYQ